MYRAALALCGRREDAEDLVQDTFARILTKPRMLNDDEVGGYLMQAMRNTFITNRRDASRRPVSAPLDFDPEETRPIGRPDDVATAMDLYAAISRLSDEHRDVIVAIDVVGLSYAEAATVVDAPEGTVMSRLYRARKSLAGMLTD